MLSNNFYFILRTSGYTLVICFIYNFKNRAKVNTYANLHCINIHIIKNNNPILST